MEAEAGETMTDDAVYERYEAAFGDLEAPFAFVDLDAMWHNADDMLGQASGKPIRVASKSVRCRDLTRRILDHDQGFQGLLNLTLPEANWLWHLGFRNLVVAYPWTGPTAIAELGDITATEPDGAPVVMVDSVEHLDLIESATKRPVRVAIDLDVGYWPLSGRMKFGPKRSPIRDAAGAGALARAVASRPTLRLVGVMAYEGQIAGVADRVPGRTLENLAIRAMQRRSRRDVAGRRAEMVAAVRAVADLEFVNGGGTGSIPSTVAEAAVTEVAAGSGFYAPMLFQYYRRLHLAPAAGYALPVARKPATGVATALGGGYVASGAVRADRQPVPVAPSGLSLDPLEGAGEAQTPLLGDAAAGLNIGDRVYLRHAKAGELCERFNTLHLLEAGQVVAEVPTYRGEGMCFL
jgi:D-serine deaminase-like pyridoxal phosphate-dependent protein